MEDPCFNAPTSNLKAPVISLKPKAPIEHKGVPLIVPERFRWSKDDKYPGEDLFGLKTPAPLNIKYFTAIPFGEFPDSGPASSASSASPTASSTA